MIILMNFTGFIMILNKSVLYFLNLSYLKLNIEEISQRMNRKYA